MDAVSPRPADTAVWDIVRVDYPFADQPSTRRRPGLVVAIPDVPGDLSVLWVAMITSAARERWPLDVPITDLGRAGLEHACVVRVGKVTVLGARLAVRIGELAEMDRVEVRAGLRDLLKVA